MKTKIIIMLCLLAGLVGVVFFVNKNHLLSPGKQGAQSQAVPVLPEPKRYPDAYPKELAFDLSPIESMTTSTLPSGQMQTKVHFVSLNTVTDFINMAKNTLEYNKWKTVEVKSEQNLEQIVATKDSQKVTVNISFKDLRTDVTVILER